MIGTFLGRLAAALALLPALLAQAGTITYFHNDLAGSPLVATNEQGQVIWRENYRPYGERLVNSAAASGNAVWFTSRRQDAESGLVYMGARHYDPVAGRFVSTDPVGFDEGNIHSFNRYAYANNNPYRYVDPDGRSPLLILATPPRMAAAPPPLLAGKPSEAQQIRNLEGFGSQSSLPSMSLPSFGVGDALNFLLGGFPAVLQDRASGLIFSESVKGESLGANPFAGKTASEIAELLLGRGFTPMGPDPEGGRGTFVNPDTGRGYHIDANHEMPKGPHVGVHRPRELRDTMPPRDYPMRRQGD